MGDALSFDDVAELDAPEDGDAPRVFVRRSMRVPAHGTYEDDSPTLVERRPRAMLPPPGPPSGWPAPTTMRTFAVTLDDIRVERERARGAGGRFTGVIAFVASAIAVIVAVGGSALASSRSVEPRTALAARVHHHIPIVITPDPVVVTPPPANVTPPKKKRVDRRAPAKGR